MTAPRPSKIRLGNHLLHPETQMLNYGYDSELSEGAGQAACVSHIDLRFQDSGRRTRFLRFRFGAQGAAGRCRGGGLSIHASTTRTARLWRTVWRSMRGGKCSPFLVRHVRHCHHAVVLCARAMSSCIPQPLYGGTETLGEDLLRSLAWSAVAFLRMVFTRPPYIE